MISGSRLTSADAVRPKHQTRAEIARSAVMDEQRSRSASSSKQRLVLSNTAGTQAKARAGTTNSANPDDSAFAHKDALRSKSPCCGPRVSLTRS